MSDLLIGLIGLLVAFGLGLANGYVWGSHVKGEQLAERWHAGYEAGVTRAAELDALAEHERKEASP